MIIELIGLPGCGKSYISALLAEHLRRAGISASEPSRHIGHSKKLPRLAAKSGCVLIYLLLHPIQTLRTAASVLHTRQSSPKNLAKSLFNLLFLRGLVVLSAGKNRVVILDQGLIQGCASVIFSSSRQLAPSFLASLPLPDFVLRVRADTNSIIRRLKGRVQGGGSRVENDPAGQLPQFEEALNSVCGSLPLDDEHIIELWNDGDSKKLNEELDAFAGRLIKMYSSPR